MASATLTPVQEALVQRQQLVLAKLRQKAYTAKELAEVLGIPAARVSAMLGVLAKRLPLTTTRIYGKRGRASYRYKLQGADVSAKSKTFLEQYKKVVPNIGPDSPCTGNHEEIMEQVEAGTPMADVARSLGVTRERVRQIAKLYGVTGHSVLPVRRVERAASQKLQVLETKLDQAVAVQDATVLVMSLSDLRKDLSKVTEAIEQGTIVELTKWNKPVAMILSPFALAKHLEKLGKEAGDGQTTVP